MGSPKSRIRGWEVEYIGNMWVYIDNGLPIDRDRPCKQCGKKPTDEKPCDHVPCGNVDDPQVYTP